MINDDVRRRHFLWNWRLVIWISPPMSNSTCGDARVSEDD